MRTPTPHRLLWNRNDRFSTIGSAPPGKSEGPQRVKSDDTHQTYQSNSMCRAPGCIRWLQQESSVVTDEQVRLLMSLLKLGIAKVTAAAKAGMSER